MNRSFTNWLSRWFTDFSMCFCAWNGIYGQKPKSDLVSSHAADFPKQQALKIDDRSVCLPADEEQDAANAEDGAAKEETGAEGN